MLTNIRIADLADAQAIGNVHVISWRESYAGIIPGAVLDALSVAERTERWRGILAKPGHGAFVAEQGRQVIGFAQGGKSRGNELGQQMELYAIYVLSHAKRHGIGTRLMGAVVESFVEQGANSAGLWVFKQNYTARRFYERLGARLTTEKANDRFDVRLIDIGYVWDDLRRSFPGHDRTH